MRPLRYSINVTLDGCCDHGAIPADEDLHRHAVENLNQADALLFGWVTYEMMESPWRPPAPTGARPDVGLEVGPDLLHPRLNVRARSSSLAEACQHLPHPPPSGTRAPGREGLRIPVFPGRVEGAIHSLQGR
jgi:hypothetical protein